MQQVELKHTPSHSYIVVSQEIRPAHVYDAVSNSAVAKRKGVDAHEVSHEHIAAAFVALEKYCKLYVVQDIEQWLVHEVCKLVTGEEIW